MSLVLRNRVYVMLDVVGWVLSTLVAVALRLDGFGAVPAYAGQVAAFLAVAIPCKFLAIWRLGLYRRYWRYASIDELLLIALAVVTGGLGAAVVYWVVEPFLGLGARLPRSVPILDAMITLVYVGGTRFLPRLSEHLRLKARGREHDERVLIVGAGWAGTMIARELLANPQLKLQPVGFVDDDPAKLGSTIQGVPVLGPRQEIPALARDYGVSKVIIAMPRAPGSVIREVRTVCERAKIQTKTIPGVFEIISGKVRVTQLRDVQIEDLLGREPVKIDEQAAAELVQGLTVLVTGAGGSIGSEICRQVARLGAARLVLLGHGENSIFDIYHELAPKCGQVELVPVIADIRDQGRMERVFAEFTPQVVFHAAAHKHVPLMELNAEEAVTNNVLGTAALLAAGEAVGVSHFVFISTDKAVSPSSVMGATKLVAEQLVYQAARRTGRAYVSVRFGNVLASRGSVVPLFQRQIAAGGPVTVTHPDMCRYFMTIPEAVQLVLQAAAMGKGGETFVLDMGQPVKIVDLARDLIELSGLELGRDIEIVYTGLRPGEKLVEQLFSHDEEVERTAHQKVFRVRNGRPSAEVQGLVAELVRAAQAGDSARVRALLLGCEVTGLCSGDTGGTAGRGPAARRAPERPGGGVLWPENPRSPTS
jgi:FlaA1/EpsC-like NDP-sugar epimerase